MLLRDLAIQVAGTLGIVSGVFHGILGEMKVFRRARIEPPWARLLMRLVWQCSSIAWIGIGGLLLVAPPFGFRKRPSWDRNRDCGRLRLRSMLGQQKAGTLAGCC
jgi:hypothetical protein